MRFWLTFVELTLHSVLSHFRLPAPSIRLEFCQEPLVHGPTNGTDLVGPGRWLPRLGRRGGEIPLGGGAAAEQQSGRAWRIYNILYIYIYTHYLPEL